FLAHMDAMAGRVLAALPERQSATIVDVGCGQGAFLARLSLRGNSRTLSLNGLDPSYRGGHPLPDITIQPRRVREDSFSELGIAPDILISRHVIEHIAEPVAFLSLLKRACGNKPVRLFLETPSFDWIAEHRVLQDVFYEHVNYF